MYIVVGYIRKSGNSALIMVSTAHFVGILCGMVCVGGGCGTTIINFYFILVITPVRQRREYP